MRQDLLNDFSSVHLPLPDSADRPNLCVNCAVFPGYVLEAKECKGEYPHVTSSIPYDLQSQNSLVFEGASYASCYCNLVLKCFDTFHGHALHRVVPYAPCRSVARPFVVRNFEGAELRCVAGKLLVFQFSAEVCVLLPDCEPLGMCHGTDI